MPSIIAGSLNGFGFPFPFASGSARNLPSFAFSIHQSLRFSKAALEICCVVGAQVLGAEEGALLAEFGEGLPFRGGLEEGAEVVAEDTGEDHHDGDGEEDPVADMWLAGM